MKGSKVLATVVSALVCSVAGYTASAQAPSVINPVSVISNQSANDGNFATGTILFQRAVVDGTSPVFGFMRQGSTSQSLFFRSDAALTNQVVASLPYDGTLTGPWTLRVSTTTNFTPSTTTIINTPAVGSVGIMPFVQSMTITGSSPLTPTISWVLPSSPGAPAINQVSIGISDNTSPIQVTNINPFTPQNAVVPFGSSFSQANQIYTSGSVSPTAPFSVPTTNDNSNNSNFGQPLLQFGHTYSIGISLNHVTPGSTPVAGCLLCTVDSRSVSFFDYTPIDPKSIGLPSNTVINLPTTTPVPTTSGEFAGPVYSFNVASVGPSAITYIDPVLANGFLYKIGANDPNFASVQAVTNVGSGIYQLFAWDGTKFVLADDALHAGDIFSFLTHGFLSGVSAFEILGLDPGVNPTDITAFVTGLTFTREGAFTGTMQPIVATPLPAAWMLMLTGLAGLGVCGYRRGRKSSVAAA